MITKVAQVCVVLDAVKRHSHIVHSIVAWAKRQAEGKDHYYMESWQNTPEELAGWNAREAAHHARQAMRILGEPL